jgi:hypothetical protein
MRREQNGQVVWWAGLACATGAVGLGLVYLAVAGAPARMIAMNIAAYLVGLAAYAIIAIPRWRTAGPQPWLFPVGALLLLATALASVPVEGAARWVAFGPIVLQVSLILLPLLVVLFARKPDAAGAAALAVAAAALALQPDRAMAGALALSVIFVSSLHRNRWTMLALAASVAGFAATLVQPDRLPAVPFVDGIFYSAFDVHPFVGLGLMLGAGLLIVPAALRLRAESERVPAIAFGAVWLAIIAAAAIGNYPTPVVGYGGSAVTGYLLSLALLRPLPARAGLKRSVAPFLQGGDDERSLSSRLA